MAASNIHLGDTCTQLRTQLDRFLNHKGSMVQPVYESIDRLVNNVRRLPKDVSVALVRSIFYPFGTLSLNHENLTFALKMVKLMNWWLKTKSNDVPAKIVLELVRECRIIKSAPQADGKMMHRCVVI
jgi:hypothetical protein